MKPITVILPGGGTWSMSPDEGRTLAEQILRACDATDPGFVDPTPLPAPALGMRVWTETAPLPGKRQTRNEDIEWLKDGDCTWGEGTMPPAAEIALITDYRTGEVLWRRQ